MKKIMVIIIISVSAVEIFSQVHIPNFVRYYADEEYFYVGYNNQLYEYVKYEKIYRNITDLCYIDNNGYLRILYKKGRTSYFIEKEMLHYLILSPKQLFVFMSEERIGITGNIIPEYLRFAEIFIDDIKSNVYLKENNLEYSPHNLKNRFFRTDSGFPYDYWSKTLPLAISNEQMSIFEMEIKFTNNTEGILLLNGFVDFFRPHLYNANRRVKEIRIIDKNNRFEQTYYLEDIIEFQEIIFPISSNNIIVKIQSYYEGNKYTDICLSSIIPIYDTTMFKEARLYPEIDYNYFINEMIENFMEVK